MNDIVMSNGELFSGEEISKLADLIINKFAERKVSVEKAKIVLKKVDDLIGEYSIILPTNS